MYALFIPHAEGDFDAVVEASSRVLEGAPEQPYARWIRGAARHKQGDWDAAREDLEVAERGRCGPFRDAVLDSLAELALERGRPREAVRYADAALALDPLRASTRRVRARATYRWQCLSPRPCRTRRRRRTEWKRCAARWRCQS